MPITTNGQRDLMVPLLAALAIRIAYDDEEIMPLLTDMQCHEGWLLA